MKATVAPGSCPHLSRQVRKKKNSAGRWFCKEQCLACGRGTSNTVRLNALAPDWDSELEESGNDLDRRAWELKRERIVREAEEKNAAWWRWYNAYLLTDKWRAKRAAVLNRDRTCRACLVRPATQAHHLTYKHVGNEPLFDLVGVCEPCHEKITEMDRENRD